MTNCILWPCNGTEYILPSLEEDIGSWSPNTGWIQGRQRHSRKNFKCHHLMSAVKGLRWPFLPSFTAWSHFSLLLCLHILHEALLCRHLTTLTPLIYWRLQYNPDFNFIASCNGLWELLLRKTIVTCLASAALFNGRRGFHNFFPCASFMTLKP